MFQLVSYEYSFPFLKIHVFFVYIRADPQVQAIRLKQEQYRKLALDARQKGILLLFIIIHDHSYYL